MDTPSQPATPPSSPETPASNNPPPVQPSSATPPQPPVPPTETPALKPESNEPKKSSRSMGLILMLVLVVLGLAVAAWFFLKQQSTMNEVATAPAPTTAVKAEKLIVGTDATLPPMEYEEEGKFLGYDIDLANALAQELNTEVEIKNIEFDNLFTALEQKKIDMIISAVTITDERKAKYDFSEPYLNAGQVIITKKDDTTIKTTANLRGKKIGVQTGTTNEKEAVNYTSENLVVRFPDFVQATTALKNGQVDAVFNDLPGAKGTITENPELKIASDPFTNEYYGIVFRKKDPSIQEVNDALSAIRIKGVLTDFKQKWLD